MQFGMNFSMNRWLIVWALLVPMAVASAQEEGADKALFEAVREQDASQVEQLLEAGADPNWVDIDRMQATSLMMAAARNNTDLAGKLLDAGARIDVADENGDPAINWAAYYGYTEMVKFLLERGASTALTGHGAAQDIAMRRGHQDLVLMLARHNGTAPELDAATLAMQVAIDDGDYAALQSALQAGATVSALDETGRPMIARAARQGRTWLVSLLLESGADIDEPDPIGYTPLMEAAREGQADTVDMLLNEGADPEHRAQPRGLSFTPLFLAAIGGNADVLDRLISEGVNLDALDSMQSPAALWALFESQPQACLALLRAGADYRHQSESGYSVASAAEEMQITDVTDWISQQSQGG